MLRYFVLLGSLFSTGCSLLPEIAHQPTLHNPFPQLSKVAIAPFFNATDDPTVNGQEVAMAYYNELQLIPGFEVVPVSVVERAIEEYDVELTGPEDARRLAQLLDVDALLVGAVTDFSPYYPPRCGLQVEWYAANPSFHPIPPGYGLPWGTPDEEGIPGPLVFEAELALARAQLKTQTPPYEKLPAPARQLPAPQEQPPSQSTEPAPEPDWPGPEWGEGVTPMQYEAPIDEALASCPPVGALPGIPPNWPDPRGFIPPPPSCRPPCPCPSDAPVIRHTQTYNGHDTEFTEALASYYFFRDDARFGGWQGYLQRSDDLIRFCCHMHVSETLSARGGAGETRVVWRWPSVR